MRRDKIVLQASQTSVFFATVLAESSFGELVIVKRREEMRAHTG